MYWLCCVTNTTELTVVYDKEHLCSGTFGSAEAWLAKFTQAIVLQTVAAGAALLLPERLELARAALLQLSPIQPGRVGWLGHVHLMALAGV